MLSYNLIAGPVVEPVTLDQAKDHLRVTFTDDDVLIGSLITAARQWAELYCNRAFFNQTWCLTLDAFPFYWGGNSPGTVPTRQRHGQGIYSGYYDCLAIRLPKPALVSVTSITYVDVTNTPQTLSPSAYFVDPASEPARIVPQTSLSWPTSQVYLPGTVAVTYVAGTYGDGINVNTCPSTVQSALLLIISHLYANRGDASAQIMMSPAVTMLLDTVKCPIFGYGNA
jgi:hypothetical protein